MLPRLLALILFAAHPLVAALEWENTRVTHRATADEESFEGAFVFRNTGKGPVTIANVSSSCGCTVPALEKRTYLPGESGKILANFTFGERLGRQVKTVNVTTDEPGGRAVVLTLEVEIPEVISLRPRFLLWRRGEDLTAKAVTLLVLDPTALIEVGVHTPDDRFAAQVEPTDEPGEFRVVVTPRDTELVSNASLRLTVRIGDVTRQVTIFVGLR